MAARNAAEQDGIVRCKILKTHIIDPSKIFPFISGFQRTTNNTRVDTLVRVTSIQQLIKDIFEDTFNRNAYAQHMLCS